MIILPVGRKISLTAFPWLTTALIIVNAVVFAFTWPTEKKLMNHLVDAGSYKEIAQSIAQIIVNDAEIPREIKTRTEQELNAQSFPSPEMEQVLEQINASQIRLSGESYYQFSILYPRYSAMKLSAEKTNRISVFRTFGFSSFSKPFPNIISHQFLHAGFLHVFFNMLFLWIVGCSVEDRWGPFLFLALYLGGGAAAAATQLTIAPHKDMVMVGASGAVSAIMGAFLIRYPTVKIRLFYFYLGGLVSARTGFTLVPAWFILPLWLLQQIFLGMMVQYGVHGAVAYWAHVGGFAFGLAAALLIKLTSIGKVWEEKAEKSAVSQEMKLEKAIRAEKMGDYSVAEPLLKEVLSLQPFETQASQSLLNIYRATKNMAAYVAETIRSANVMLDAGNTEFAGVLLEDMFRSFPPERCGKAASERELFQLSTLTERLEQWQYSHQLYQHFTNRFPDSVYYPKAVFSLAKILHDKLEMRTQAQPLFAILLTEKYRHEWGSLVHHYLPFPERKRE